MSFYAALEPYLLAFIPLFIAIGALDFLPIVLDLSHGLKEKERQRLVRDSTVAAAGILVVFLFAGKGILLLMGVTVADFMVAGGLLLLILSLKALINDNGRVEAKAAKGGSIVPLATPLIAGPAALTTTLILLDSYGITVALVSILLNCLAAWAIFNQASRLRRLLGERAMQGITKVSYILLASIAVMMVRKGIGLLP